MTITNGRAAGAARDGAADPLVVLVHGAWHGGWAWDRVTPLLQEAQVRSVAPDLPQLGVAGDIAHLHSVLDGEQGPFVLCGHSYGADLISHVATSRDDVAAVVYVAGMVPGLEPSWPGRPRPGRNVSVTDENSVSTAVPEHATAAMYADCDPELAAWAISRLRPVVADALTYARDETAPLPIHRVLSAYGVCTEDQMLHPDDQRELAAHADIVVEWPTSHSPMLSRPDLVAGLLLDVVGRVRSEA